MKKVVIFKGGETVSFNGEAKLEFYFSLQKHITGILVSIDLGLNLFLNFLPSMFGINWISDSTMQTFNVVALFIIVVLNYTLLDLLRRLNFIKRRWPNGNLQKK